MDRQDTSQVLALAVALHREGRAREALQIYGTIGPDAHEYAEAQNLIGVAHLQLGDPHRAAGFIETAIALRPEMDEAHYNLGVVRKALGELERAAASFNQAIAINSSRFDARLNLAVVLQSLNRPADAINSYVAAIALKPGHAGAYLGLSGALQALHRYDEALRSSERAIALNPLMVEAHVNRGAALQALGRRDEAANSYKRAIELNPGHAGAHFNLGTNFETLGRKAEAAQAYRQTVRSEPNLLRAWQRLAVLSHELGHFQDAREANEQTLRLAPHSVQALVNLGAALQALHRPAEAAEKYRAALDLRPDHAAAHSNLGAVLRLLGRYEEAIESSRRALALDPNISEAETNLANALKALGRDEEALQHYDTAIALAPQSADARANKGLCSLHLGRLGEGFDLREARWEKVAKDRYPRYFRHRDWNGDAIRDGALLVWGDEGLGDQVLYAGMLHDLTRRVRRLVVEVEPRLVQLFRRSFPDLNIRNIHGDEHGTGIVAHVPLTSLGRFLRRDLDAIPRREDGYLKPDPALTAKLRGRLKCSSEAVIGLSWISQNPTNAAFKTAKLADFESLLRLPRCRFVDLQYGDTSEERAAIEQKFGIRVERLPDVDNTLDIDGLAALISACDLVATVSNTTAHLAGALGRDTRVFVPQGHARLWYWFRDGETSPWYPRVHLHRQANAQRWSDLVATSVPDIAAAAASADRG